MDFFLKGYNFIDRMSPKQRITSFVVIDFKIITKLKKYESDIS